MTTREEADNKLLRYLRLDQFCSSGTTQDSSTGHTKSEDLKIHPILNLEYICDFFRDKVSLDNIQELLKDSTFQSLTQDSTSISLPAPSSVTAVSESAAYSPACTDTHFSAPPFSQAQEAASFHHPEYNIQSSTSNQQNLSEDFTPDSAFSQHQTTFRPGFSTFSGPACSFVSPIPGNQLFPIIPVSEPTAAPQSFYSTCTPFNSVCNCPLAIPPDPAAPLAPSAPANIIPISCFPGTSGDSYTPAGAHSQPAASKSISYGSSANSVNFTQHTLPASEPVFMFPQALVNTGQSQNQAAIPIFVVSRPSENSGPLVAGGAPFFPINPSYPTFQGAPDSVPHITSGTQN